MQNDIGFLSVPRLRDAAIVSRVLLWRSDTAHPLPSFTSSLDSRAPPGRIRTTGGKQRHVDGKKATATTPTEAMKIQSEEQPKSLATPPPAA